MSTCQPRSSAESIRTITNTSLANDVLALFQQTANLLVSMVEDCLTLSSEQLSAAETYLACHLLSVSRLGQSSGASVLESEKFEQYSVKWAVGSMKDSMTGLLSTHYGQIANALTKGCLTELDKQPTYIGFYGDVTDY